MLATHLHLALRLRVGGVIPLLPLYNFIARTGKFYLFYSNYNKSNTSAVRKLLYFNPYPTNVENMVSA
jgi:hypothetical protein